ncbi:MAG: hypothetical protein F6K18_00865 [Okeania sp. SIO2C2]|uniref:hypothetical protein n=1 Tax=Okeania sp. SIO2C2 TaxID=2607787 RepID=UPI0013B8D235|nr:hypothetical protein [Okeania sp. SIO2C2]NEP85490.1 hypothetical protein [Okeania sp. SIO2C2]
MNTFRKAEGRGQKAEGRRQKGRKVLKEKEGRRTEVEKIVWQCLLREQWEHLAPVPSL